MQYLLIISVVAIFSNWSILSAFLNKRIILKEKNDKHITEDLIQSLISSITNGLIPRVVLGNLAQENELFELSKASKNGEDLVKATKIDTNNDLTSTSFAQIWQVCEKNGASLSPILSSFNNQIRTESELRQELASSLSGVKLSAYVLAFLPLIGIFLAYILGVNSLDWLLNSSFGKISFFIAIFLELIGLFWVKRLILQVENIL